MARNATIDDAVKLARQRFEDCALIESDYEEGRKRYAVTSEHIGSAEFDAFDGEVIAFVSKHGEIEYF